MLSTAADWIRKLILAKRTQEYFSSGFVFWDAIKYAIVESREAVKASNTKKCPHSPIFRCSPANGIVKY
jgi:hypothetical protein